jgi:hypothetical protein
MAERHWVGSNAIWDSVAGTKWALTSGGVGGQAVPTSLDDVFFDAGSGSVFVGLTAATVNAKTLICTGFTGTLSGSSQLNVAGNVTFFSGMTLNCTGLLNITAVATLTSGNKTWGGALTLVANVTHTFINNWTIGGNLTAGNTPTLNGGITISVGGSYNIANSNLNCNLIMNGTGTLAASTGIFTSSGSSVTINTTGTTTIGNLVLNGAIPFTYSAGTVNITTGTTLSLTNYTSTLNINPITLYNLTIGGVSTVTLGQNVNVRNLTTIGTLGQTSTLNGNTLNTAGLTKAGTSAIVNGTTNIVLNGTGSWTDTTSIAGGYISNNITINTSGVLTLVGSNHRYRTGTITYTSGTVIPGTSTFNIDASTTLNTNGMSFYNLTLTNSPTITNNSLLSVSNNLSYAAGSVITFAGTNGWTTKNFYILTSNNISHTLVAGKSYRVTTYFESISTTSSLKDSLISSIPGTKSVFTLDYGATQNVGYTNAVDIDSSIGQTIWTFNGVVTRTNNWNVFDSSIVNNKTFIF